jgi:hypothetical protein
MKFLIWIVQISQSGNFSANSIITLFFREMVASSIATNDQSNNEESNANLDKTKGSDEKMDVSKSLRINEKGHVIKHKGIR